MFFYESSVSINAPPDRVWEVLTDLRRLTRGFGILRIDGTISLGAKIKVWSEVSPNRGFPVRVTVLQKPEVMIWRGGMPFGLFRGERRFSLNQLPSDGTGFTMREEFSGALSTMIRRSMPDLSSSFDKFAAALKREAET